MSDDVPVPPDAPEQPAHEPPDAVGAHRGDGSGDIRDGATRGTDDRERFAADLRELRLSAGSPTLAALGHTTGVSKTVLSEAFSGRRLPSARTVAAVAAAFDGDVRAWVRRRDAIDGAAQRAADDPAVPDDAVPPALPAHPVVRRRTAVLLAAAAFVVGVGCTVAGTAAVLRPVDAAPVAAATPDVRGTVATQAAITVPNGTDPADTACVEDAEVVASETRTHHAQLQVIYSASCHAAWARITRYDAASHGNTVSASIYRQIAPNAKDRQTTTEPDAESAYTTLLVRPTPATRLCADGSITVDGRTVDLGDPLCL